MNTIISLALLCSLLGSSLALDCWSTRTTASQEVEFKAMRDTNVINMERCNSTHETSCFKRWYKVVGWGDYYYALGCSDQAAAGEVEKMKGPSGKEGSFYCTGDFCNSSGAMGALMGLTVMAVLANLMK